MLVVARSSRSRAVLSQTLLLCAVEGGCDQFVVIVEHCDPRDREDQVNLGPLAGRLFDRVLVRLDGLRFVGSDTGEGGCAGSGGSERGEVGCAFAEGVRDFGLAEVGAGVGEFGV